MLPTGERLGTADSGPGLSVIAEALNVNRRLKEEGSQKADRAT
jgi:hypothetical protein